MADAAVIFLCLVLCYIVTVHGRSALYNTTSTRIEGKLNVHVISHTHNDPGWLLDYVQYYRAFELDGHRLQGVEGILDTAVHALIDNPDRTWVYADLAFFVKWWQELHPDTKKIVRKLVKQGRWEFTNGGISQHDEATSHYSAMVDQMTVGMRFLYNEFGIQPKVAWQLDGFGHSNTEPLLKAMGGFTSVVFGRSDRQDFDQRKAKHQLELVWQGSRSFGAESELFTSQYPTGNYEPPTMNWWFERRDDYGKRTFTGIMDDPESREYNLDQAVSDFVKKAQEWQSSTQGNDVMFFFGGDFTHGDARSWYNNVDKLIHYANKDGRVNAFYSTPSRYFAAKRAGSENWALKEDDFFPYSANAVGSDFWTGYFASRPTLKIQVRKASALLQATRQLEVLAELQPSTTRFIATSRGSMAPGAALHSGAAGTPISSVVELNNALSPDADTAVLEYAVAMSLHHDGLTGTSKLPVIQDYQSWLHVGMVKAVPKLLLGLQWLLYKDTLQATPHHTPKTSPAALSIFRRLSQTGATSSPTTTSAPPPVPELSMCLLLNSSVCAGSVMLSKQSAFLVVVYNPLSWSYKWGVRIPVGDGNFVVQGPDGKDIPSQMLPLRHDSEDLLRAAGGFIAGLNTSASADLAFQASAPPLGHAVYKITRTNDVGVPAPVEPLNATNGHLSTGILEVELSHEAKAIRSITVNGNTLNFTHGIIIYQGHHMSGSGAYTFRANTEHERAPKQEVHLVKGPVVSEVREIYKDVGTLVTRLWKGADTMEVEWTLAPPPKHTNWEAFIRYESAIASDELWFTDANGMEWQQRYRQYRPSYDLLSTSQRIPGNIYPVTTGAFIKDSSSAVYVSIDRAQGCTSLNSGELDFLVHRGSSGDDGKGMREPLIESNIVSGLHIVSFGDSIAKSVHRGLTVRHFQQALVDPLQLAFSAVPGVAYASTSTGLVNQQGTPGNVHILTLKWLSCNTVLLRLSNMFMTGEHAKYAQVAELKLGSLIDVKIKSIVESTLYGERPLTEADKQVQRWPQQVNITKWKPPLLDTGMTGPTRSFLSNRIIGEVGASTTITLNPMQIRTFTITVEREHTTCADHEPEASRQEKVDSVQHGAQDEEGKEWEDTYVGLAAGAVSGQQGAVGDPRPHDAMRRSSAALLYSRVAKAGTEGLSLSSPSFEAMLMLPFIGVMLIACIYVRFKSSKLIIYSR